MNGNINTTQDSTLVGVICELFEVLFHEIIYTRKLYPDTIFESRRKFGVFVRQSIHPDVNSYIENCVKSIHFFLSRNQLKNIYLMFSQCDKVLEKYNFEITNINANLEKNDFLIELEQHFRDCVLKLLTTTKDLQELPDDSSFSICLNVPQLTNLEFQEDSSFEHFQWINLEKSDSIYGEILPLQSLKCDYMDMQLFIEKLPL